jgi:serine protease AprX
VENRRHRGPPAGEGFHHGDEVAPEIRVMAGSVADGDVPGSDRGGIGTFNTITGTSMAAPHIAGMAAQLFQLRPSATPAQVELAIKSTAYKYVDGAPYVSGTSFDKGHGLVDVVAAANALAGMVPAP